jgi:hypothetical protein
VAWEHPANNDFLLVSQFSATGALYTCRPDLVGFVNPDRSGLVVIELKKPGVPARAAFGENLTHYKQRILALLWFNALLIASNGTDSRVGSLTADWGRFPSVGASPLCPATVRAGAGFHNPFRSACGVAWPIRDVLLKRKFPRLTANSPLCLNH